MCISQTNWIVSVLLCNWSGQRVSMLLDWSRPASAQMCSSFFTASNCVGCNCNHEATSRGISSSTTGRSLSGNSLDRSGGGIADGIGGGPVLGRAAAGIGGRGPVAEWDAAVSPGGGCGAAGATRGRLAAFAPFGPVAHVVEDEESVVALARWFG